MSDLVPDPARVGRDAKRFGWRAVRSIPGLARPGRKVGQRQMHLQDRTVAERGRSDVVGRPALRKDARIDGLAVLAGSRPYP